MGRRNAAMKENIHTRYGALLLVGAFHRIFYAMRNKNNRRQATSLAKTGRFRFVCQMAHSLSSPLTMLREAPSLLRPELREATSAKEVQYNGFRQHQALQSEPNLQLL